VSGWDAILYLRYEDERTRPARDLLAQIPIEEAARIYDLGCGPGNATELLAARFPRAEIVGIDSSEEMLERAQKVLPDVTFRVADLTRWRPEQPADLLFANAVFQWVPNHLRVLQQLIEALPSGGILAVQIPDNLTEPAQVLIRETADDGPWAKKLDAARASREIPAAPEVYYEQLRPLCQHFDIWHTIYNHALADAPAIVEWMMGTALRPCLSALDKTERAEFLASYGKRIATAYPRLSDGRVLLSFPRLFFIAVKA